MYQCQRCLAPLRMDQGRPVQVCDRCGAPQPFASPPQRFAPPPPFASPRAPRTSPLPWILLVVVVLTLLGGGLVAAVLLRQRPVAGDGDAANGGPGQGRDVAGAGDSPGGPALWDDAASVKEKIGRQLGRSADVTEVLLYRDYAFVEVQEGGQRVRHELRGGTFKRSGSSPSPPRSPRDRPEEAIIKLDDVDFGRVSAMVKEAQARVGAAPGEHIHVRLARHLPFLSDALWSVYLGQGSAEFDLSGKLVGGRTAAGVDLEKELVHYFDDPSPVRAALVRRFGAEVELIELVLYSTYAIGEVRDPRQKDNVDRYTIRPGGMSPGDPMRNARSGWDKAAFRLDTMNFALYPKLAADARGKLRGEVTHIILEKGKIRVYVSDARNSGYVSYHADGRLDRVVD